MKYQYKIVLLGSSGVGKTSFLYRKKHNKYKFEYGCPTIGCNYFCFEEKVKQDIVVIHYWDTAGQERFHSIAPLYYKNANCIFIMFDINDYKTFEDAKVWMKEVEEYVDITNKTTSFVLIGTKLDLKKNREVSVLDVNKEFQKKYEYIEISTKDNVNMDLIDKIIYHKLNAFIENTDIYEKTQKDSETIILHEDTKSVYDIHMKSCCSYL